MTFSEKRLKRLKEAFSKTGLTQKAFAARMDKTPNTIGRWLKGESTPQSKKDQKDLASALGVRYEWLFDDAYDGPARPENQRPNSVVSLVCEGKPHYETRPPDDFSESEERYVQAVREILRSGVSVTVAALKSNIVAFRDQVDDKQNLNQLMTQNQELIERVAELERNAQDARARGPGSIGPDAGPHDIRAQRTKNKNHDL